MSNTHTAGLTVYTTHTSVSERSRYVRSFPLSFHPAQRPPSQDERRDHRPDDAIWISVRARALSRAYPIAARALRRFTHRRERGSPLGRGRARRIHTHVELSLSLYARLVHHAGITQSAHREPTPAVRHSRVPHLSVLDAPALAPRRLRSARVRVGGHRRRRLRTAAAHSGCARPPDGRRTAEGRRATPRPRY